MAGTRPAKTNSGGDFASFGPQDFPRTALLLMGADEEGTLERLKALRRDLADVRKLANRRNGDDDPKITEFAVQDPG